jgi:hypothetical protein
VAGRAHHGMDADLTQNGQSGWMALWISERKEHLRSCLDCGLEFPHITGYVLDADGPRAVYFASCHTHADRAARVDVILGTWGANPPAEDHVTFSCELRPTGAMALDAPATLTEKRPVLGALLSRPEALAHPRAAEFWAVVDLIATQDPAVVSEVYQGPS